MTPKVVMVATTAWSDDVVPAVAGGERGVPLADPAEHDALEDAVEQDQRRRRDLLEGVDEAEGQAAEQSDP